MMTPAAEHAVISEVNPVNHDSARFKQPIHCSEGSITICDMFQYSHRQD